MKTTHEVYLCVFCRA